MPALTCGPSRAGLPLWRLLLDLSPEQIVNLLDLSYLEDVLTEEDAAKAAARGPVTAVPNANLSWQPATLATIPPLAGSTTATKKSKTT